MLVVLAVTDLDHLVLRVADVEASLAWYCGRLGLEGVRVEEWRSASAPFPSVRVSATAIIDLIARPSGASSTGTVEHGTVEHGTASHGAASEGNLDHLCLVVVPCDLADAASAAGLEVSEGPVARFGARGWGTSIYVHDPDGNLVELRHYG
ncbi:MAG TPA: VOC family protein [Acidimicrobiales bacterium]|nr:VOC family protein [Acidimicrobiales bacterium]